MTPPFLAAARNGKAYDRIKEESPSNAEKVREGITEIIDNLPDNPEKYPPDKFKKDNPAHPPCEARTKGVLI